MTPVEWKRFYERERARLGRASLEAIVESAPTLELGRGAIFPHTRLEVTGLSVAAVARAVVASGAGEVLAIGVLHGSPPPRRVHLEGQASTACEFSLDAFGVLLSIASERARKARPRVHARYPSSVGIEPASVEGIDELARLGERMPVVATADPLHHGIGYGDDAEHALARSSPSALHLARTSIDAQLDALSAHDFNAFQAECARVRSDFRNAGPAMAHVLGEGARFEVHRLDLVDYAEALGAPDPTWVAGALVTF